MLFKLVWGGLMIIVLGVKLFVNYCGNKIFVLLIL